MNEVVIGLTKRATRGYSLDDVAVIPSRRTRDPDDVSLSWTIDGAGRTTPVQFPQVRGQSAQLLRFARFA